MGAFESVSQATGSAPLQPAHAWCQPGVAAPAGLLLTLAPGGRFNADHVRLNLYAICASFRVSSRHL